MTALLETLERAYETCPPLRRTGAPKREEYPIYDALAAIVDSLEVDKPVRLPFRDKPRVHWYHARIRLNRFVANVKYLDNQIILIRFK